MDREDTLDIVTELRRKIVDGSLGIRWPSSEMLASSVDRRSNRRGPGDEFDALKEYEAGDDLKQVDWIATQMTGDLMIKNFYEPKVVRFNVLLDVNPSMSFGTVSSLKSRLAALCAGCGIYTAGKMKDRVSYATFSNEPKTVRKGQAASRILMDFLMRAVDDSRDAAEANEKSAGGGMEAAFNTLAKQHRSVVLLVSDFVNMSEDDWEALRVSGFKHDTIAVFVQDLRERELPEVPWPGASYSFEDSAGNSKTIWVAPDNPPKYLAAITGFVAKIAARLMKADSVTTREKYRENFRAHEAAILDRLESYGIKSVVVSTEAEMDNVQALLRVLANKR